MSNKKDNIKLYQKLIVIAVCAAIGLSIHYFYPDMLSFLGDSDKDTGIVQSAPDDGTSLTVHYIDVGQGDSELIVAPNGDAMLIDAGPNSSEDKLCDYLDLCHIKTIKYLVLTHPHEDHIGGADKVLENFNVQTVIMPDVTSDTSTYRKTLEAINSNSSLTIAETKEQFNLGKAVFTILGPVNIDKDNLNNCSIVLRLDFGKNSFMFTGDAESESEQLMLQKWPESYFKADVLKIGHHGSSSSTSKEFLTAVSPSIAVISCAEGNDYGHPHTETIEKLDNRNISCKRTDRAGTIIIVSDGEKITVGD